jgi:hypothetical protein
MRDLIIQVDFHIVFLINLSTQFAQITESIEAFTKNKWRRESRSGGCLRVLVFDHQGID